MFLSFVLFARLRLCPVFAYADDRVLCVDGDARLGGRSRRRNEERRWVELGVMVSLDNFLSRCGPQPSRAGIFACCVAVEMLSFY